jgi:hypothetical protein
MIIIVIITIIIIIIIIIIINASIINQQWHQRVKRVRADLHRDIEKMVTEVRRYHLSGMDVIVLIIIIYHHHHHHHHIKFIINFTFITIISTTITTLLLLLVMPLPRVSHSPDVRLGGGGVSGALQPHDPDEAPAPMPPHHTLRRMRATLRQGTLAVVCTTKSLVAMLAAIDNRAKHAGPPSSWHTDVWKCACNSGSSGSPI